MTLLRHTHGGEVVERQALTINPAKTCQPVGAMYAALGLHRCLPHSHGSQGCCSYHRSALSRHYKEPVMAGTSSFTEGSSVFGGQANLHQAISNIFTIYQPDVIAVHTTCLSETIGDDIPQIVEKATEQGLIPEGKYVIHANTPSYVGAAPTGFANMTAALVKYFSESTSPEKVPGRINVIPGWVEPADMREIKRLVRLMGLDLILFPDTSDVLDCPQTGIHEMFPKGGVTIEEMRATGDSAATIALGPVCSGPAAKELSAKCGVPQTTLPLPIGLEATDQFIMELRKYNGGHVPQEISDERGRLIDMITDMHQYFYDKTAALWGDPDQLVSLSQLLMTIDILPKYVVTGTPGKKFLKRMADVLEDRKAEVQVRQGAGADMFLMHQWIKNEPVDLLLGNTYGKHISRDDGIPFVRHGFPILDRVGHQFWVRDGRSVFRGAAAAQLLWERQREAIRELKARELVVKINTILIPGVNDQHIEDVARTMRDLGVDVLNCVPMYPVANTPLADVAEPSPPMVAEARRQAGQYLPLMHHCTRCRADAAGLLGEQAGAEQHAALQRAAAQPLVPAEDRPCVAAATLEGLLVNQHLGEADQLHVFRQQAGEFELVETRSAPRAGGGDQRWQQLADVLHDCRAVLVSSAGSSPVKVLARHGIRVVMMEGLIEEGLEAVYAGHAVRAPLRREHHCDAGVTCGGNGLGCL